jgi:hypothetical protein
VWLYGPTGVSAASDGQVWAWVESTGGGAAAAGAISAAGRYQIQVEKNTTWVSLFVRATPFRQPCAVGFSPKGDFTADISLAADPQQLSAHLPPGLTLQAPTLSGVVYEQTPNGKRPIADAWVGLDGLYGDGVPLAETLTDADGRYVLCGVPQREKTALFAFMGEFETRIIAFEQFQGRATFDIEMTRSAP